MCEVLLLKSQHLRLKTIDPLHKGRRQNKKTVKFVTLAQKGGWGQVQIPIIFLKKLFERTPLKLLLELNIDGTINRTIAIDRPS